MIIWNASTDGSVEMPGEFLVTADGQFFAGSEKEGWIRTNHPETKAKAFDAIMREQYGIEVK